MSKPQKSKRGRANRKAAKWAKLNKNTAHPSHVPNEDSWVRNVIRKKDD